MTKNRAAHSARPLSVFCLLPTLNPYGGVVSVVNLLNLLVLEGHSVTLASLSKHPHDPVGCLTEPIYSPLGSGLDDVVPRDVDILLATSWETVAPIVDVASQYPDARTWYFVQDIEGDFYNDDRRAQALATYEAIDRRFVKTRFLQRRLSELGHGAELVRPGMNLDIFYPQDLQRKPASVLAMARPPKAGEADHRGFATLLGVYESLADRRPEITLSVFGNPDSIDWPIPVESHGRIEPSKLPGLYSSASVYLDSSQTHGFGRTGVEAMACGAVAVMTRSGGVEDYAVDGENALLCPVDDIPMIVEAIERLIDNPELAAALQQGGFDTVKNFDDRDACEEVLTLWRASL